MLVSMYMTRDPIVVAPRDDVGVAAAAMARHACRCLPVVEGERLVGVVSRTDLARALPADVRPFAPEQRARGRYDIEVGDVMSGHVVTVAPDDSIDGAVGLLDLHKLSVLVVTRGQRVVGVLSRSDILRAFRDVVFAPTATRLTLLATGDVDVVGRLLGATGFARLRLRAYAEHEHDGGRLVELALEGPAAAVDDVLARAWGGEVRVLHVRRPVQVGN